MTEHLLRQYAEKKGYKILYVFDWAFVGWDGDEAGLVVEDAGKNRLLLRTADGAPYVADFIALEHYLGHLQSWLRQAETARGLLGR